MDKSRILLIGRKGPFRTSSFNEPPNLAEFNAIIWHPDSLTKELQAGSGGSARKRMFELIDWIKQGNLLIIVGAPPEELIASYVEDRIQCRVDLRKGELFSNVSFKRTSGHLVEYCGPDNLATYLSGLTQLVAYDAILTGNNLFPLFQVSIPSKSETQLVGAYRKLEDGVIVYAPILRPDIQDLHIAPAYAYFLNLARVLEVQQNKPQDDLPDWVTTYQTQEERNINKAISEIHVEMREQKRALESYQVLFAKEQAAKTLFTSTGDTLVLAVAEGLRELGLAVVEGPKQRADLIAFDGTRLAALEVKGLEGGAREKNVGQVKRWTADLSVALSTPPDEVTDTEIKAYQEKLTELAFDNDLTHRDTDCKGILILNTFRKLPLQERLESYPDPVSKIVTRSGVCALTGLQLFLLLQEMRTDPSKKKSFIDKLFTENGVLSEGLDWATYLQHEQPECVPLKRG